MVGTSVVLWGVTVFGIGALPDGRAGVETTTDPVVLSDDAGWCWFEGPRAVIVDGKLVVGTVANGRFDLERTGDIEAIVYDPEDGSITRVELHDRLQADDHDSPAFLPRPDGRLLTLYAKHGPEPHFYYRISEPNDPTRWGPERTFAPSPSTRLTYSNVYRLPAEGGRIYDFFRGFDDSFKPSYAYSDDEGESLDRRQRRDPEPRGAALCAIRLRRRRHHTPRLHRGPPPRLRQQPLSCVLS